MTRVRAPFGSSEAEVSIDTPSLERQLRRIGRPCGTRSRRKPAAFPSCWGLLALSFRDTFSPGCAKGIQRSCSSSAGRWRQVSPLSQELWPIENMLSSWCKTISCMPCFLARSLTFRDSSNTLLDCRTRSRHSFALFCRRAFPSCSIFPLTPKCSVPGFAN